MPRGRIAAKSRPRKAALAYLGSGIKKPRTQKCKKSIAEMWSKSTVGKAVAVEVNGDGTDVDPLAPPQTKTQLSLPKSKAKIPKEKKDRIQKSDLDIERLEEQIAILHQLRKQMYHLNKITMLRNQFTLPGNNIPLAELELDDSSVCGDEEEANYFQKVLEPAKELSEEDMAKIKKECLERQNKELDPIAQLEF